MRLLSEESEESRANLHFSIRRRKFAKSDDEAHAGRAKPSIALSGVRRSWRSVARRPGPLPEASTARARQQAAPADPLAPYLEPKHLAMLFRSILREM